METMSPSSSSLSARHEASNFDELSMEQSLLFSDSLKDLKNLRSQLYSAAEYFELIYTNDDQKQIVVSTLKDYTVKALVNTLDHLGLVSYKVNGLLDEKVGEVYGAELRVSCIEQRLRTCQDYIDREGLSQQSLMITAPKFHKHYILPGVSMPETGKLAVSKHQESNLYMENSESQEFQSAVRSTIRNRPPSFRKMTSLSHSPRARSSSPSRRVRSPSPTPHKFSVADKRAISPLPHVADKKAGSSLPSSNPLTRSGSLSCRSNVLINSSIIKRQFPAEPQKSASMRLHAERIDDIEQNSTRSRSFLKTLLTRRRSGKDEKLYTYLDEY